MNAITPVQQIVDAAAFDDATSAVNAWRGQVLQCFAQAEAAVSETLLVLASRPDGGVKVKLRRLVGQKFGDLCAAVDAEGPFANEGKKAALALDAFRQHDFLRPLLCHGVAKVTLDRQGRWLVVFKVLAFRGRQAERSSIVYDRREAEAMLDHLDATSKRLSQALQSLRDRMAAQTPSALPRS